MLELFANLMSGGLLGIVGSVATGILGYFSKKAERKHALDMEKAKRDTALAVTKATSEAKIAAGELSAFKKSYEHDMYTSSSEDGKSSMFGKVIFAIVDLVRMLIRPGLTIYLIYLTTMVYQDAHTILAKYSIDQLGGQSLEFFLSPEDAVTIVKETIKVILTLTAVCVGWWFSDRSIVKNINLDFKKS